MTQTGWLDKPEERTAIPRAEHSKRGMLKAQLDWIMQQGGAGKPFLLKHAPMSEKHRLQKQTHNYRGVYGNAGFTFLVRRLPSNVRQAKEVRETHGEDAVGLWAVWQPVQHAAG